jgi:hypothetical protein
MLLSHCLWETTCHRLPIVQEEAGNATGGATPRQHGLPEPGGLPLNGLPGDPAANAALVDRLQRELRTVAALEVMTLGMLYD